VDMKQPSTRRDKDLDDILAVASAHGIHVLRSTGPDPDGWASITFARPEDVAPFLNLITTWEAPDLGDLWTFEGEASSRCGDDESPVPDYVLNITVTFPAKDLPYVAENARGKPTTAAT
jgi:hypothetical protein